MRLQDFRFDRRLGSVRHAVLVPDAGTGRSVLRNPAAKIFGYSSSEALGLDIEALEDERLRATTPGGHDSLSWERSPGLHELLRSVGAARPAQVGEEIMK